jgi:hypothetical protein
MVFHVALLGSEEIITRCNRLHDPVSFALLFVGFAFLGVFGGEPKANVCASREG